MVRLTALLLPTTSDPDPLDHLHFPSPHVPSSTLHAAPRLGNVVANVAAQFISVVTSTARVQPSAATDRVRQRAIRDNNIITAANAACMGLSRTAGRVQSDMSLFMSTFTSGMTPAQKRALVREAERLKRIEPGVRADAADAADAEADCAVAGLRAFQTARVTQTGTRGVLSYVHKGRLQTGERTEGSESDFALFQRSMNAALSLALVVSTPPRVDKFKVANLKATASDLDVDISAAKSKAEIAAAIHSSLTSSLGEGASFKYVLKEMGKSVGDEHAEFWDKAAAEVAEAKGGAPAAMDVVAGNT